MERILIFIKHHFIALWNLIEWINGKIFLTFYTSKLENTSQRVFKEFLLPPYSFRKLVLSDAVPLNELITSQSATDLEYFHPHDFDINSLTRQMENPAFFMMGSFSGDKLIGYFFLRLFSNSKCFVGRLICKKYRGAGIGRTMNSIMYEIAWRMDFHCLSTISRNNVAVMHAHAKNPYMVVIKELQNDFLLVEFVRETKRASR